VVQSPCASAGASSDGQTGGHDSAKARAIALLGRFIVDFAYPGKRWASGQQSAASRRAGGAGGSIDSSAGGTGGSIDSSAIDGPVDRSVDTQACIQLADIPPAYVRTKDPSTRISSMWVLDGPCDASASMSNVTFYYWEKGYSCPRLSDRVTYQVEATSSAGATTVFSVDFLAVPLGGAMLHWQAEPSQITLSFPRLDGGAAGG
jgi:hypothetical protein